jgi:hypothetical protein
MATTSKKVTFAEDGSPMTEDVELSLETRQVAAVIGQVTFQELFTQPWNTMVDRMKQGVTDAIAKGELQSRQVIFDNTRTTFDAEIDAVSGAHATTNLRRIFETEATNHLTKGTPWLPLLGILGLTRPTSQEEITKVLESVDRLAAEAGSSTFESMYETTDVDGDHDKTELARAAINFARTNGIMHMPVNGLCCTCTGGCHCVPGSSTSFCSVVGGKCTVASTPC